MLQARKLLPTGYWCRCWALSALQFTARPLPPATAAVTCPNIVRSSSSPLSIRTAVSLSRAAALADEGEAPKAASPDRDATTSAVLIL